MKIAAGSAWNVWPDNREEAEQLRADVGPSPSCVTSLGLDVVRLARALHASTAICLRPVELCVYDRNALHIDWANAIAAEYARLAAAPGEREP